jgi:D-aspartate ligase
MSIPPSGKPRAAFILTHESNPHRRRGGISLIALALTRSLGRQGVPVVRIHPNHLDHGLRSRYATRVCTSPDMYDSEAALVDYLLELARHHGSPRVLIPASDDCAQFLGKHRDTLGSSYEVCVAESRVMDVVVDKQRQHEEAERYGVPLPETYFPTSVEAVRRLTQRLESYPYVIKPTVAHTWRLASMRPGSVSKGQKAILVRSGDELVEAFRRMGERAPKVMVQEVVGGRDEQLFTFLACFGRTGAPLAYCVRRKMRQLPIDFGYCTSTLSCHNQAVVDLSLRLLQGIGYSGICGVEYKFDAVSGEHKLIEINARAVNTIGIAPACGVDIPHIAYRDALGEAVEPVTTWRDGVRWYWLWPDFLAAREIRRRGGPGYGEWWRSLRGEATEAISARDDPMPGFLYYRQVARNELRKRLGRAVGRPRPFT